MLLIDCWSNLSIFHTWKLLLQCCCLKQTQGFSPWIHIHFKIRQKNIKASSMQILISLGVHKYICVTVCLYDINIHVISCNA